MVKYRQKGFTMTEYTSLEKIRLEKIDELAKGGIDPFPTRADGRIPASRPSRPSKLPRKLPKKASRPPR